MGQTTGTSPHKGEVFTSARAPIVGRRKGATGKHPKPFVPLTPLELAKRKRGKKPAGVKKKTKTPAQQLHNNLANLPIGRNPPSTMAHLFVAPQAKRGLQFVASTPQKVGTPTSGPAASVSFRSTHEPNKPGRAPQTGPDAGVGRMNKIGTSIERILPDNKNLRPDPVGVNAEKKAQRLANRWLSQNMSPEDLMSPDGLRYTRLLDDPLNAPWGDQGEVQVRPLIYEETVPPSTTKTIRCFGQQGITIPDGDQAWVVFCVGAGNPVGTEGEDGDDLTFAWPNWFGPAVVAPASPCSNMATLGAPNNGIQDLSPTAGGGNGIAGYYYVEGASSTSPPSIGTFGGGPAQRTMMPWGSPPALGGMSVDDSAQYKFRPVAGGLLITPTDTTFASGGFYDAMIIPQATNEPYVTSANDGNGSSANCADILALPDHCIERADAAMSVNWLPGRGDYGFLKTAAPGVAIDPQFSANGQDATCARVFVRISPPAGQAHNFILSYTGFYEVAGRCVQQVGSVPRAQPTLGAKVATSVQNNLNIELDDRSRQVSEGTTLELIKDHPKIGPMVENCDSMPKAKSALSSVIELGSELLPLVGLLL